MSAKWIGSAWTIAPLPTIPMVGAGAEEAEAEEPEEAGPPDRSLTARLEKAAAESDHERQEIFQNLKEFRKKKKLNPWIGLQEQARLEMRAEMNSLLQQDAERSARERMNGGAMANNGGVISYVEDGNGKLVRSPARRRSPADNIHEDMYVSDENGDLVPYVIPPRRFTQNDSKRANKNRTRYTRSQWCRKLLDFAEGRISMTKQEFQAHLAMGDPEAGTDPRLSKR